VIRNEVWIHVTPTKVELARHGLEPSHGLEIYTDTGMVEVMDEAGLPQSKKMGLEQKCMGRGRCFGTI
jgi:platelet-activating factor acetylhydrolase